MNILLQSGLFWRRYHKRALYATAVSDCHVHLFIIIIRNSSCAYCVEIAKQTATFLLTVRRGSCWLPLIWRNNSIHELERKYKFVRSDNFIDPSVQCSTIMVILDSKAKWIDRTLLVAYDSLTYNMASVTLTTESNNKLRHCHLIYIQTQLSWHDMFHARRPTTATKPVT